jgi:AraC-like DNA-binding protein
MNEEQIPICKIPCETMPLVGIAAYNEAQNTMIHVDRIADFHVLIYIIEGSMEIIEEGITYTLKQGSLFFLKANVHHWGVKPFEPGTRWYYIHFYAQEPGVDFKTLELKQSYREYQYLGLKDYKYYIPLPKHMKLPSNSEIVEKIRKLITLYQSYELSKLFEVNLMLWKIFLHCYEVDYYKEVLSVPRKHVRKIAGYLENNYKRQFSGSEMEQALGLSYKYIGTLLKNETKMTIKEYQQMLRIKEAERLLCFTNLSVTEIAETVGYGDVFYFSNVFKKTKGISPMKFRSMYIPYI